MITCYYIYSEFVEGTTRIVISSNMQCRYVINVHSPDTAQQLKYYSDTGL